MGGKIFSSLTPFLKFPRTASPQFSFLVQRRDEPALLNLFDVGWIDNQVRVGLLCLRILIRKYFQRGLDHLQRRDRYRFQRSSSGGDNIGDFAAGKELLRPDSAGINRL